MCMLCNDETAYRAYMDALDAMEARGEEPDLDRALEIAEAALAAQQAADDAALTKANKAAVLKSKTKSKADYMSAFICDPVEQ